MVASTKYRESRMTKKKAWSDAAAALAAMALAAMLAGPAAAQSAGHDHDAATEHKLSLDHGSKWATDDALRDGMERIRGLVEPQLGAAHAGRLSAGQYRKLALQVESEVGGIVANCKLEPKADAMLHLVIAGLGEGTEAMAGKSAGHPPVEGLGKVVMAVNEYARHFDHPGFRPIHAEH